MESRSVYQLAKELIGPLVAYANRFSYRQRAMRPVAASIGPSSIFGKQV